jgi:hypothetical protein
MDMIYTLKIKDGDAWLSLLDEKGETETFPTFSAAVIRAKVLVEKGEVKEAEVWSDRPMLNLSLVFELLVTRWLI